MTDDPTDDGRRSDAGEHVESTITLAVALPAGLVIDLRAIVTERGRYGSIDELIAECCRVHTAYLDGAHVSVRIEGLDARPADGAGDRPPAPDDGEPRPAT